MPVIVYPDHICPNAALNLGISIRIPYSMVKNLSVTFDSYFKKQI